MQTYTHYVMTAIWNRTQQRRETAQLSMPATAQADGRRLPPPRPVWLMLGSMLPDLPLIAITIFYIIMDGVTGGRAVAESAVAERQSYVGYLFDYMFFHEPWVQAAHNLFHAPLLLLGYLGVGYWGWRRGWWWGGALFWLASACALHTAIDIPLHYNDGPLVFFPFDWQTRFYSPVSYWDPAHYGVPCAIFEHLLLLGMLISLARSWWQRRRSKALTS